VSRRGRGPAAGAAGTHGLGRQGERHAGRARRGRQAVDARGGAGKKMDPGEARSEVSRKDPIFLLY
jgi:hypothetical protein